MPHRKPAFILFVPEPQFAFPVITSVCPNKLNPNPETLKWTARIQWKEGCWLWPNHFPSKPFPSVFVSEGYFGFVWPSCISICRQVPIRDLVSLLTDRCIFVFFFLYRTACLRHHRLRGSWAPTATTRTCIRPRRKAIPASIIMTTTLCPGPWRLSFTTWSQM